MPPFLSEKCDTCHISQFSHPILDLSRRTFMQYSISGTRLYHLFIHPNWISHLNKRPWEIVYSSDILLRETQQSKNIWWTKLFTTYEESQTRQQEIHRIPQDSWNSSVWEWLHSTPPSGIVFLAKIIPIMPHLPNLKMEKIEAIKANQISPIDLSEYKPYL